MSHDKVIFWFRQDLRLSDNLGLNFASTQGEILPIFIYEDNNSIGAASRVWLHESLEALNQSLDHHLYIAKGDTLSVLTNLIKTYDIKGVYWNRYYDPHRIETDTLVKAHLLKEGIQCESFKGSVLFEPWEISTTQGEYYKVFTPFYNACLKTKMLSQPLPSPANIKLVKAQGSKITDLGLLPSIPWHKKMLSYWEIGEAGAHKKLKTFKENNLKGYAHNRDMLSLNHTSQLSPHLHFGEISPTQIWSFINDDNSVDAITFKKELLWREFCYYLLFHFPKLQKQNFKPQFNRFEWDQNDSMLKSWQKGQTGIPVVDAAMRELWKTGTMHNRARMIVASFLIKNCLIDWRQGEQWFFDCLFDADIASNSFNWQWVAGSGADAAPYFRIFNPILQSEKFDSDGTYIKKFVPELASLSPPFIFAPWTLSEEKLKGHNIVLGKTYPFPIVDLKVSREEALRRYKNSSL